jgi:hypothetical protein
MNRLLRNALIATLLTAPLLAAAAEDKPVDGKTYTGTITKHGETQGDPDDFVFKDGTFISTACAGFGFKPAVYTTKQDGKRLQFDAVNETDNGVHMHWKGFIQGDRLEATADWLRPEQPVVQFHAQAALKH